LPSGGVEKQHPARVLGDHVITIPILDDEKKPTGDFILGRSLVRANAWIHGDRVLAGAYGFIDTGPRSSSIAKSKTLN
jgi:hypothetical protein